MQRVVCVVENTNFVSSALEQLLSISQWPLCMALFRTNVVLTLLLPASLLRGSGVILF